MADLFFTGWRKWGALASILLALLVPMLLVAKAHHETSAYPVVQIKITGYDPRDILYGHYMLYQFDWDWVEGQPPSDEHRPCHGSGCCLCLGEGHIDPGASIIACDAPKSETPQCAARVKGSYYNDERFHIGHNRYYVAQTRALELERLLQQSPEKFRMGITLPPSGKPRIKGLYIDGQLVEDYLRATPPADLAP